MRSMFGPAVWSALVLASLMLPTTPAWSATLECERVDDNKISIDGLRSDWRDVTIEPEGAAADQKRVDIRLTNAGTGTLPVEVKRDDNGELWTAMRDQLLERYTNDPKTGGFGIYLVIWYGNRGNGCKSPPKELCIETPTTAMELQAALEANRPDSRFVVRVIDVAKPQEI